MEITELPFIGKLGITKNGKGLLELPFGDSVLNHLQTIYAGALFTLAEAASGDALQNHFPELVGKVVPVLRDSQIKFRKPAMADVTAYPSISTDTIERFNQQLAKKGRAVIEVGVEIRDQENTTVCSGSFNWFVQQLEN